MRLYGRRFWAGLGLGLPPTLLFVGLAWLTETDVRRTVRLFLFVVLGSVVASFCYLAASRIASDRERKGSSLVALAAGILVFLPMPVLIALFYLPGLAWFALFGLAVPVALFESRTLTESFRRAIQLARVDYAHVLGSLAAVTIVALISAGTLGYLLVQFGDQAGGVAAFIAVLLISPLVLFAAALLYEDQEARLARRP
jgi:hypothetical protein